VPFVPGLGAADAIVLQGQDPVRKDGAALLHEGLHLGRISSLRANHVRPLKGKIAYSVA
jgi:hypothetical protein